MLEDFQHGEQLAAPKGLAAAFIRQGGERANHVVAADIAAEVALQPPDRHQNFAIHAIALFDTVEAGALLREQDATTGHASGGHRAVQVLPDWTSELRLAAVGGQNVGVRADAGKGAVEQFGIDAGGNRVTAQQVAPIGEAELFHDDGRRGRAGLSGVRGVRCGGQRLRGRFGTGSQ
ncbi:hypothetical protein D9M68_687950 [compost metagenome]